MWFYNWKNTEGQVVMHGGGTMNVVVHPDLFLLLQGGKKAKLYKSETCLSDHVVLSSILPPRQEVTIATAWVNNPPQQCVQARHFNT